jgi:hypothetical protein
MTDVAVTDASLQIVHKGSTGARLRATGATLQVVGAGYAFYVRVTGAALQTIHQGADGGSVRAVDVALQVVRGGVSTGAYFRDTTMAVQTVYTIGVPETAHQRAWTFDLDGHTMYVLDLGDNGTLLYDLSTNKWYHFETAAYGGHWNMKNGLAWRGGKMVVAGDAVSGAVRKLDVASYLDEGFRPIQSELRGALFSSGTQAHKQYTLRLIGSAGSNSDDVAPVLNMQFSDDQGITWSSEYAIALVADTRQRLEFRSLGSFAEPGRIFRIYDQGGVKYIAYVVADMDSGYGKPTA